MTYEQQVLKAEYATGETAALMDKCAEIAAEADAEIEQLKAQLASAQNLASHHDHEAAALAHLHGNAVDWRDELLAQNASLLAALERIAASDTTRAPGVIARAAIASAKEAGKQ